MRSRVDLFAHRAIALCDCSRVSRASTTKVSPDVMRGEETQIVGAVASDASPTLAVLPGTHSKWTIVRGGAIESFATYMTGEVYAVLRDHSILGRMAERTAARVRRSAAFARGVQRALTRRATVDSLLHQLFGARTLSLRADLAPEDTGDYLSGLLIGSEIAAGREWARTHGVSDGVGAPARQPRALHTLCGRDGCCRHRDGMRARTRGGARPVADCKGGESRSLDPISKSWRCGSSARRPGASPEIVLDVHRGASYLPAELDKAIGSRSPF